jgi:HD-GYP domain-containing protein (c-di-GMP phosphodiesterase class II)
MKRYTDITSKCDPYTRDHQSRVSALAVWIGQQMELPPNQIEDIRIIGLVHDIGKIALPPEFMVKTDQLNDSERMLIRNHPQIGYDILAGCGLSATIRLSVLQHHEHIDGSGYPKQLRGDQILKEAKIVAVADVIDAMTSHRPYNSSLRIQDAIDEITKNSGKYYDPKIVKTCLGMFSMKVRCRNETTAVDYSLDQQQSCC